MKGFGFALAVWACCLTLGACRGQEATDGGFVKTSVTAPTAKPAANLPAIRARIHAKLPDFTFTLVGGRSAELSDTLRIKRIEIRRGVAAEPFQVIDGLDSATPVSADNPGLTVLDMNFDGYGDIRLVELQPAGPNVPYLNWLFNPATERFEESRALNAITRLNSTRPAARSVRTGATVRPAMARISMCTAKVGRRWCAKKLKITKVQESTSCKCRVWSTATGRSSNSATGVILEPAPGYRRT